MTPPHAHPLLSQTYGGVGGQFMPSTQGTSQLSQQAPHCAALRLGESGGFFPGSCVKKRKDGVYFTSTHIHLRPEEDLKVTVSAMSC